jgi:hypothetical protein
LISIKYTCYNPISVLPRKKEKGKGACYLQLYCQYRLVLLAVVPLVYIEIKVLTLYREVDIEEQTLITHPPKRQIMLSQEQKYSIKTVVDIICKSISTIFSIIERKRVFICYVHVFSLISPSYISSIYRLIMMQTIIDMMNSNTIWRYRWQNVSTLSLVSQPQLVLSYSMWY